MLRYRYAARSGFGQHAQGQHVGAAEHGVDIGNVGQQGSQPGTAICVGRGRFAQSNGGRAQTQACSGVGKTLSAPRGTLITTAQQRQPSPSPGEQVLAHGGAERFMAQADEHVDGGVGEVPGFNHRNARGHQQAPSLGRMHDPGEYDPIGPPAHDGAQQRVFAGACIAHLAHHDLKAAQFQRIGEGLHHFTEQVKRGAIFAP